MAYDPNDPFGGGESHPSISWKGVAFGTTYTGEVAEKPTVVQSRNFETGEPDTWPDGNPKMVVCTTLKIGDDLWNLWAAMPSALFAAIKAAQVKAGSVIDKGGILTVTVTGEEPNTNPRLNPTKQFTASYTPPAAFGNDVPQAPASAPAPAAAAAPAAAPPVQPELPVAEAPAAGGAMNAAETAKALLASGMDNASVAAATGLPVNAVIAIAALG